MPRTLALAGFTALFILVGCSSADSVSAGGTPKLPTVLVTNSSCQQGGCRTLEVRAFAWGFTVPQQPTGFITVGEVAPGTHCLAFPVSWTVSVVEAGKPDTTHLVWTPATSTGVFLIAVDSAMYHSSLNQAQADSLNREIFPFDGFGKASVGSSGTFVPASASGWSVSFPSAIVGEANLITTVNCKP